MVVGRGKDVAEEEDKKDLRVEDCLDRRLSLPGFSVCLNRKERNHRGVRRPEFAYLLTGFVGTVYVCGGVV